jgi:hypothetical protein
MATETLRPSSDGDVKRLQIYPSTPTTHYDKVDDVTSDGDTTYVQSTGGVDYQPYDLYHYPASAIPAGSTINSVTAYFLARSLNASYPGTLGWVWKTHATEYKQFDAYEPPTSYTTYSKKYTTNPYTGLPWTLDEINALQVGPELDDGVSGTGAFYRCRCTMVYLVIDYTPPAVAAAKPLMDGLVLVE